MLVPPMQPDSLQMKKCLLPVSPIDNIPPCNTNTDFRVMIVQRERKILTNLEPGPYLNLHALFVCVLGFWGGGKIHFTVRTNTPPLKKLLLSVLRVANETSITC